MIRINHLRKEYPNVTPLKDVNVEIHKGDVISIIGPSGTGKSTLIRCINMLDPPTSGKRFIDDEEILASLTYAQENKNNKELIESIIEKASECRGLSHREAVLLLACDDQELNKKIYSLAKEIKQKIYGNRICAKS